MSEENNEKIPYEMGPLLIHIVQQAQADDYITHEEAELINRIQIDVRDLEKEIAESLKGNTGKTPKEIFMESKDKIIENARQTALRDGIISEDEQNLLDKLLQKLKEYE
jgi:hypothetical protein